MWLILIIIGICVGLFLLVKRASDSPDVPLENTSFPKNNKLYAFEIVGEQAYQHNLQRIAGEKEEEAKFVEVIAKVSSDPLNKYDKNAIKVEINGLLVGFISKEQAKTLTGKIISKSVPAVIVGGWLDDDSEGSYGVKLSIVNLNELVD
ncbi:hypothetical protein F895_02599 [Acinetobacter sp. CIP 64.2]|uniref:hypothetical protein n=1 Tax=Acinetobacter sp. CIP 64.2 TaxID=1217694 RepID=UPI00028A1D1F|nr:hypothetical protein [Acinetobacter sp. CIP 64.2]ENX13295.1 hypothetical protein F895_02599 [Acinetobacter sp. CIP 64.2]